MLNHLCTHVTFDYLGTEVEWMADPTQAFKRSISKIRTRIPPLLQDVYLSVWSSVCKHVGTEISPFLLTMTEAAEAPPPVINHR